MKFIVEEIDNVSQTTCSTNDVAFVEIFYSIIHNEKVNVNVLTSSPLDTNVEVSPKFEKHTTSICSWLLSGKGIIVSIINKWKKPNVGLRYNGFYLANKSDSTSSAIVFIVGRYHPSKYPKDQPSIDVSIELTKDFGLDTFFVDANVIGV